MAASYQEWKDRADAHLAEGRVIEALSCFRKAARLRPGDGMPLHGIADSLWRLGKAREAVAAWRVATRRAPGYAPAWRALAEAAAFIEDDALAADAAARALKVLPRDRRARLIDACSRMADPVQRDDACATLADLVATTPRLVRVPHLGRLLARALADAPDDRDVPLRRMLAADAGALPLDLVAQLVTWIPHAVLRARIDHASSIDELDALRLLAAKIGTAVNAADIAGANEVAGAAPAPALAQHAADRYAALCASAFAADVPLQWPLRAAGERARVVMLVDVADGAAHEETWNALVDALQEQAIDAAFAVFGDAQRVVERLQTTPLVSARVTQMPSRPDTESARALAALDPDLLVDLTFPGRSIGPLLAARPARHIAGMPTTPHLTPPLVDTLLPADTRQWRVAIAKLAAAALARPRAASTAQEMQTYLAQAIDAHRHHRYADARHAYDAILSEQPAHAPTLHLRGALRRARGDSEGATEDFTVALAHAPRDVKLRVALAQTVLAGHRPAYARELLDEGLLLVPGDVSMLRTIGHAALAQRDGAIAIEAFAAALARDPLDAETHFNHGVALQMQRYLGDAARAYQRSLDLSPTLLDAHFNLGVVFSELGEVDSAVDALEFVLARQPARADAHRTLLDVLSRADRGDPWMRAFERFETRCPDALGLVANALEFYQYRGDYAKVHHYASRLSRGEFKPASELDLVDSLEQLLYLMLFFDIDAQAQSSLYSTYDQAAVRVYGGPLPRSATRRPGPLRIGYLSADLRDHVMGNMMLEPLRQHDRSRYRIHVYSTSETEDHVTAAFRALADHFESLANVTDDEAVRRIGDADLDILVDLSTHTRGARPAILARKPARTQITHVASAGALGMSAVDFKLTDRYADLPANDKLLVETLLPMEGCVYPWRRMIAASDHPYHRNALGIGAGEIIIGAFVTPLKLSRRTMALWKEVLDALPHARLAFSPTKAWLGEAYPRILVAAGIDPARAIILPRGQDDAQNLARYCVVDFVLDPMPFGNVNGTLEPLNMQVPVVTLKGQSHGERTGYSILSNLGETRTIAGSGSEYVEIAVRLATDHDFMRDLRASIGACIARVERAGAGAYTSNLEAAYEAALAATAGSLSTSDADER